MAAVCGGWPRPLHEVRSFVTEAIKTGHFTPSPAGKEEAQPHCFVILPFDLEIQHVFRLACHLLSCPPLFMATESGMIAKVSCY